MTFAHCSNRTMKPKQARRAPPASCAPTVARSHPALKNRPKRSLAPPGGRSGRPLGRRPKAIPPDAAQRIRQLAAAGATFAMIAHRLGIGKDLFRQWLDGRPELTEAIEIGRAMAEKKVYDVLWAKAMKGDTVALLFIAKCRFGWREQGEVQDNNRPVVNIIIRAPMNPDNYRPPVLIEHERSS